MTEPYVNPLAKREPDLPRGGSALNICGFHGEPMCSPPDCAGTCPAAGFDSRPEREVA
jgi:hypothetical protein